MQRKAFTVVELVVAVAVLVILVTLTTGVFGAVKSKARFASCAFQMHGIHTALLGYAAESFNRMPPFQMSTDGYNLPLGCHWGGDPPGVAPEPVNLWALIQGKRITTEAIICPAAATGMDADASYFGSPTARFSTYSLRMPYSQDLFRGCEMVQYRSPGKYRYPGGAYGVYMAEAGGKTLDSGGTVPTVRIDRRYRSAGTSTYTIEMSTAAWVVDGFWRRNYSRPASGSDKAVQQDWWHKNEFNVLDGTGAVTRVIDKDGFLLLHSEGPEGLPKDNGVGFADHSEEAWRFFDTAKR